MYTSRYLVAGCMRRERDEANIMSHEYRILEQMLLRGEITSQEFKERIDISYKDLEQEFMNDEITPDQHVERYNELIQMESQPFGEPGPHEHI